MDDDEGTSLQLMDEGTTLRRFFFRNSTSAESPMDVVTWWESRRIAYNAAVGITGVVSLLIANVFAVIGPGGALFGPPIVAIVMYALLANLFYTGGWIAELILRPVFGRRTPVVGSALFRYGFAFSVGLTLLPTAAAGLDLIFRIVKGVLI